MTGLTRPCFKKTTRRATLETGGYHGRKMSTLQRLASVPFIFSRSRRENLCLRVEVDTHIQLNKCGGRPIPRLAIGLYRTDRDASARTETDLASISGRLVENKATKTNHALLELRMSNEVELSSLLQAYSGLNPEGRVLPSRVQRSLCDVRRKSARFPGVRR